MTHTADRCATLSKLSHVFFRRYRHRHLAHEDWHMSHVNCQEDETQPQKFRNLTNLRWAQYRNGLPEPPLMPPWGVATVTTTYGSLSRPFRWQPL